MLSTFFLFEEKYFRYKRMLFHVPKLETTSGKSLVKTCSQAHTMQLSRESMMTRDLTSANDVEAYRARYTMYEEGLSTRLKRILVDDGTDIQTRNDLSRSQSVPILCLLGSKRKKWLT